MSLIANDRVFVFKFGFGVVTNIRHDSRGDAIYTVTMNTPKASADGFMLCRDCELRLATNSENIGFDNGGE